jgi:hypothetical protein
MQIESSNQGEIISNNVVVLESEARITAILAILMVVCCKHGNIFEKERQAEVILYFLCTPLNKTKKKPPWLVVRKRTIPTERPPLVSEASANF